MDFSRLTGSPDLDPVANVQPYSYRDARTHLEDIKNLAAWVNREVQRLDNVDSSDSSDWHKQLGDMVTNFNKFVEQIRFEINERIINTHDQALAFDPTNGTITQGLSTSISRMYDNLRVYALFAKEFDEMGYTAKQWDEYFDTHSARHFDLGATYPRFNEELKEL